MAPSKGTMWFLLDDGETERHLSYTITWGRPAWGGSRFEPPINPPDPDEVEIANDDGLTVAEVERAVEQILCNHEEPEQEWECA